MIPLGAGLRRSCSTAGKEGRTDRLVCGVIHLIHICSAMWNRASVVSEPVLVFRTSATGKGKQKSRKI